MACSAALRPTGGPNALLPYIEQAQICRSHKEDGEMHVQRLSGNPIIRPHMDRFMGANVQGPSLIRVPDWIVQPLGTYYLYFADHKGRYIGFWYALAMPGFFSRSRDGLKDFEPGPRLFDNDMRHSAVLRRDDRLYVFWTRAGDAPERILLSTIALSDAWETWQASAPQEVLRPETAWEGADLPIIASVRGAINVPVNQLRDPCIYEEDGHVYLLYAVAGEHGIAMAEVFLDA
jgi:hypothetical protein